MLFQRWSTTLKQRWSTTLKQRWSDIEILVGYFFEGFQPQNVLLLILLSIEYSYLLTTKIVPDVKIRDISLKDRDIFVNGWLIGDIERFNATLEEYKIIYPNGKSDYIAKDVFDGVQVFFLSVNF